MGVAVVERCSADGHVVIAVDRERAGLDELARRFPSVHALVADLADPTIGERVLAAVREARAPLVGLVNLAGVSTGNDIEHIDDDAWDRSMVVNATAPMRICRALVPELRAAGGGSIVNVGSPVALLGARKVSYSASKAALLGLTVALARALGKDGIRVNALLPGPTLTGMTADWDEAKQRKIASGTFLGRLCEAREVAGAVAFLLGRDSSFVTGAVLDVTGGSLLGGHA
jgi:NAD(P)-dependent dehydrogenase (short-subunit alcohol dehydrogenase family)